MSNQPGVNVSNSTDQGGAITHIGGSLILDSGSTFVGGVEQNLRARFTTAQINAGATVVAAIPGYKLRMISARMIAIGADATTVTTVDLLATQAAGSVKLLAAAQASLTRSAVISAGGTGGAVLADGASFVQNDVNTAITIGKTGASLAGSTGVDLILSYAIEP